MFAIRKAAAAALLAGITLAAVPASAADSMGAMNMDKARFSDAVVYKGAPNLPLTLSMIVAGGGPAKFDTKTLVGSLAGPLAGPEVKSLTEKYGADKVGSFLTVFDFVVSDALKIVTEKKIPLPSSPKPDPKDGKALSAALYTQGVLPSGSFDVEYLLDGLVSHGIHVQIMDDIDTKYGRAADSNYHVILTQAIMDLKAAYKL